MGIFLLPPISLAENVEPIRVQRQHCQYSPKHVQNKREASTNQMITHPGSPLLIVNIFSRSCSCPRLSPMTADCRRGSEDKEWEWEAFPALLRSEVQSHSDQTPHFLFMYFELLLSWRSESSDKAKIKGCMNIWQKNNLQKCPLYMR